jgi:hypothetical protein
MSRRTLWARAMRGAVERSAHRIGIESVWPSIRTVFGSLARIAAALARALRPLSDSASSPLANVTSDESPIVTSVSVFSTKAWSFWNSAAMSRAAFSRSSRGFSRTILFSDTVRSSSTSCFWFSSVRTLNEYMRRKKDRSSVTMSE